MANGYQINIEELGGLINSLDLAAQNMTNATTALRNASAEGLGNRAIDGAGKDFQERWGYGIGKIADAAGKMTESLHAARKDYQQTEDAVAQLFPPQQAPLPPGPVNGNWGAAATSTGLAPAGAASPTAGATEGKPAQSRISQALDGPAPAAAGQESVR